MSFLLITSMTRQSRVMVKSWQTSKSKMRQGDHLRQKRRHLETSEQIRTLVLQSVPLHHSGIRMGRFVIEEEHQIKQQKLSKVKWQLVKLMTKHLKQSEHKQQPSTVRKLSLENIGKHVLMNQKRNSLMKRKRIFSLNQMLRQTKVRRSRETSVIGPKNKKRIRKK